MKSHETALPMSGLTDAGLTDAGLTDAVLTDAVLKTDRRGCVLSWNVGAEALYGYTAEDVLGRHLDFLQLPGDRARGGERPPEEWIPRQGVRRHRTRDGRGVTVALRLLPWVDESREQTGWWVLAFDLAQRPTVDHDPAALLGVEAGEHDLRRLAGRVFVAQEEERRRLARELHDDFGQRLASLGLDLDLLRRQDVEIDLEHVRRSLDDVCHDLRRLSHELHPATVERFGLTVALQTLVDENNRQSAASLRFSHRLSADLPPELALPLYRIAQEALANALRHGEPSYVHVSLVELEHELRLAIVDDGQGFDTASATAGLGLASMRERSRLLAGHLVLHSVPQGGTEVVVTLPLPRPGNGSAAVDGADDGPRFIGPYRLLEMLGDGGSSNVYLAEEPEPLGRLVAVKILRAPLAGQRAHRRFKAEQAALARLHHPAIAQVFEARTAEDATPYIVMEYVPGVAITRYCDRYHLTIEQRLELFMEVCQGVQHAHRQGVLHRDLKPSNVLVTEVDERPVVKIIDFGIAKGLEVPLTDDTVWSTTDLAGTPAYLAPEAVDGTRVDTRSDVYALGMLLFEILCGGLPVDPGAPLAEIFVMIRQGNLRRPSEYFQQLDQATAAMRSAQRGGTPAAVVEELRRHLDWIVHKALQLDVAKRYQSPRELAEDIQSHLYGRTPQAGPPPPAQRFRRLLNNYRVPLAAAGALCMLLLIAGLAAQQHQRTELAERRLTQVSGWLAEHCVHPGGDPQSLAAAALHRLAESPRETIGDAAFLQLASTLTDVAQRCNEVGRHDDAAALAGAAAVIYRASLPADVLELPGSTRRYVQSQRDKARRAEALHRQTLPPTDSESPE